MKDITLYNLLIFDFKINTMSLHDLEKGFQEKIDQEIKDSQSKNIQSEIAKIWVKENFSIDAEKQFFEKYKNILTEKYILSYNDIKYIKEKHNNQIYIYL